MYHSRNYLKLQNYKLYLSNEERTFDIQFSPLRNEELGVVEGIIIVFDDVTELYNLQKEMEKERNWLRWARWRQRLPMKLGIRLQL